MRKALSNGSVGKFENPLRMHALLRSMQRNGELIFAASTAEEIRSASAGDWSQRRSRFTTNPATGTLEIPLDLRLKARKALRAEVCRLKLSPYLSLALLYLSKFRLKCLGALKNVTGDHYRDLV